MNKDNKYEAELKQNGGKHIDKRHSVCLHTLLSYSLKDLYPFLANRSPVAVKSFGDELTNRDELQ